MVTFSTHIKGNTLDLVLTDKPDKILSVCTAGRLGRSDHEILVVELAVGPQGQKTKKTAKNWRRANWSAMREEMRNIEWNVELESLGAEEAWNLFKEQVDTLVEKYVPTHEIHTADRPPWMTVSLLQQLRQNRRLWSKYKNSPSDLNRESYKCAEKSVHKQIKKTKKTFELSLTKEDRENKRFYAYMRSKTCSQVGVGPLKVGTDTITDSKGIADTRNNYFGSVFHQENLGSVPVIPELKTHSKCQGVIFRPSVVKKATEYSACE